MHVDAAWAGSAAMLPEQRQWFQGLEKVDSYSFNPHSESRGCSSGLLTAWSITGATRAYGYV
jgi:hypothetical protein